jgi:hypothetical protein
MRRYLHGLIIMTMKIIGSWIAMGFWMECVLINLKHDFIMPIKYLHAKIFVFNYICKLQFHVVDKFVFFNAT